AGARRARLSPALAGPAGDARRLAARRRAVAPRPAAADARRPAAPRAADRDVGERAPLVGARNRGARRPPGGRRVGTGPRPGPRAGARLDAARGARALLREPVRLAGGVASVPIPVRVAPRPADRGHLGAGPARLATEPLQRPAAPHGGLAGARAVELAPQAPRPGG